MTTENIEARIAELHATDERNKVVEACAMALADAAGDRCFAGPDVPAARALRDKYRDKVRVVLEAAGYDQMSAKLDELAHTHRRHDINGQSYCADHDGHNGWTPYPCATRLTVDGATAS